MALSDLAVFTEWTVDTATQAVAQQAALFNAASQGAIVLRSSAVSGDFSDSAMWAPLNGMVRRRNAYGSGVIPEISLAMVTDTMVKIAAGTPVVRMDPAWFNWIKQNPAIAGVKVGQALARDMVLDMFNTAVLALLTSLSQVGNNIVDRTTGSTAADRGPSNAMFNAGQAKFGDAFRNITGWLMHSSVLFDIFGQQLTNNEKLFTFDTLGVMRDPFGRTFIVSDAPGLRIAGNPAATPAVPDKFITLGLVPGAVTIEQQPDFTDNTDSINGNENIKRTYQAEWSYMCGVKGFAWNKTAGGKSPTDAAIGSSGSWTRVANLTDRDMPGVLIKTAAA